jgi:hypothetical protein
VKGRLGPKEGRREVDTPGDARRRTEMTIKRAKLSDEKGSKKGGGGGSRRDWQALLVIEARNEDKSAKKVSRLASTISSWGISATNTEIAYRERKKNPPIPSLL